MCGLTRVDGVTYRNVNMCRSCSTRKEEKCPISNRVLDRMTDWRSLLSNLCLLKRRETIYNCVLFSFSRSVLLKWSDIDWTEENAREKSPCFRATTFTFLSFLFWHKVKFSLFACIHALSGNRKAILDNNTLTFLRSILLLLLLLFPYNYSWLCFNLTATCSLFLSLVRFNHSRWSRILRERNEQS